MEQANLLNDIAVGALVFLALALFALLAAASTLLPQATRTLNALERLANTLEEEMGPTLKEVQKVIVGVGELKQITQQRVAEVGTKVEDVTGSITKAADSAKRSSSVMGAGIWAGFKAYLEGKNHSKHDDSHEHITEAEIRQDAKHINVGPR